jgi:hypothetical protein
MAEEPTNDWQWMLETINVIVRELKEGQKKKKPTIEPTAEPKPKELPRGVRIKAPDPYWKETTMFKNLRRSQSFRV